MELLKITIYPDAKNNLVTIFKSFNFKDKGIAHYHYTATSLHDKREAEEGKIEMLYYSNLTVIDAFSDRCMICEQ